MENFMDQDALEFAAPDQNFRIEQNPTAGNVRGGQMRTKRGADLDPDRPAGERRQHRDYLGGATNSGEGGVPTDLK